MCLKVVRVASASHDKLQLTLLLSRSNAGLNVGQVYCVLCYI